ncbi:MAG: glycoside hydrolase family 5 protein [Ruminococcus sp.]|nr:glycoside hydrolase family 5 protein [Ruminococcus sp.]
MHGLTTADFVKEMGVGINLGNTFEACGGWITDDTVTAYETAWGSPVVTEEMIKGYAEEGFGALRVPVAWSNMMEEDYTIHPDYIARVKEVVEWALKADLAVILNIHWDGGWWENFPTDKEECMKKYTSIWTQLCDAFGEYGDKLMFESLNEEAGWSSIWDRYTGTDEQKQESYALVNEINQTFVDLVRSSGGNNAERHLLIAGYITDVSLTCDPLYQMPEDPQDKCAVSVHYYTPSTYCILTADADWGKARANWGSPRDYTELENNMQLLYDTFVSQGVPVIIGEYGAATSNKTAENVNLFLTSVAAEACKRDMCPVLWSTPGEFYDRTACEMEDQALMDGLLAAKG